MQFAVTMSVAIPHDLDPQVRADIVAREKDFCHALQRSGEWVHIWRCVGQYSNISIFDVEDHARLHEILSGLPLFPFMTIDVTPLTLHPSDLAAGGDGASKCSEVGARPMPEAAR